MKKSIFLYTLLLMVSISAIAQQTITPNKTWIRGEIPGGQLVLEELLPLWEGGYQPMRLKLVYTDTTEVIVTTDPTHRTLPINRGYLGSCFSLSVDDPLYEGITKRNFVLTDTTFTCIWSVFDGPFPTRSYWFTRFKKQDNQWKLTNIEKIHEHGEGVRSAAYGCYFINENIVYLKPDRYDGFNAGDMIAILKKDGKLSKFVIDASDVSTMDKFFVPSQKH